MSFAVKSYSQCDPAIPCVNNINDYQCITTGTVTALMGANKLLFYPGPAETTPQKIIVSSSISFNQDYKFFEGSEIILLPGANLSIGANFGTLGNVTIRGCGDPWGSIKVFNNGTFNFENGEITGGTVAIDGQGGTININGTTITKSCVGVDLNTGTKATILNGQFEDNFYGIRINGSITLLGEGIAHNTIELPVGAPSNCFSGAKQAIQLNNVPFILIGNSNQIGAPNTIKNYQIGIKGNNSNMALHNTVFRNATGGVAMDLVGNGGVFNANINGLGGIETSTAFTDNYGAGIRARSYNLILQNAHFKNGTPYLNVGDPNFSLLPVTIEVKNNCFELFSSLAITCTSAKFISASIHDNLIIDNLDDAMQGQTRTCIKWTDNTMVNSTKGQILHNTIKDNAKLSSSGGTETWQHFGVSISTTSNISNVNVEQNELQQNYITSAFRLYEGIKLFNAPFNSIQSNHLTSVAPSQNTVDPFFSYKGIYLRESGSNLVSCNNIEGFDQGISFEGPACDKTQVKRNTIQGDNLTGLLLNPGTIIGQQLKKDNVWPNTGMTEALFDGNPGQGLLAMSLFTINTPNMNSAFWPDPRVPGIGWFVLPLGNPTPNPPNENCYLDPEPPNSEADRQAITGEFQAFKGYPASVWEARLNAYRMLSAHPELLTTGSVDMEFFIAHDAGNIGKLSRSLDAWEGLALFSTSFESNWEGNQTAIAQKIAEIEAKTLALSQASTPDQQAQIIQEIAALEAALLTLQESNQALSTQYQSTVSANAAQLLNDLDDIVAVEVWETNLKTVLSLVAQSAGSGSTTWTTAEQNMLLAIADQCRFAGGIGVVMARAILELYDYDDQATCPGYAERNKGVAVLPVSIAPNPSADLCTLTFSSPFTATVLVNNMHGALIRSLEVTEATTVVLDTREWANGMYTISINDAQGQRSFGKLVVLH